MRRYGFLLLMVACLSLVFGAVCAQTTDGASTIWPTYHNGSDRGGQNTDSTEITNPSDLKLIWTWPRNVAAGDMQQAGTSLLLVDGEDPDSLSNFDSGGFVASDSDPNPSNFLTSTENYLARFYYALVSAEPAVLAKWTFPTASAALKYSVQVLFPATYTNNPSGYTNTQFAEYNIRDSAGVLIAGPFIVNQTDTSISGKWHTITTNTISMPAGSYVELRSRRTGSATDSESATTITVADAVRIVGDTKQEVYASPVSGEIPVNWNLDTLDATNNPGTYNALSAVVFAGTVEQPFGVADSPPDSGAIYCINSVTAPPAGAGSALARNTLLKRQLGETLWRYPRHIEAGIDRDPLEGPIQGGLFSSPTLVYYQDMTGGGAGIRRQVLVATGMDGQIYCLDPQGDGVDRVGTNQSTPPLPIYVRNPKLLWKGPGITVSEPTVPVLPWVATTSREDAFGGQFITASCVASGETSVIWDFPDAKRKAAGEPDGDGKGWDYNVFAWIPAVGTTIGTQNVVTDAVYRIVCQADEANSLLVDYDDLLSRANFDSGGFGASGGTTSAENYLTGFYYALISTEPAVVAKWKFPKASVALKYDVQVWFPATYTNNPFGYTNNQFAEYNIRDSGGSLIAGPFIVDQTDTSISGKWHTITPNAISMPPNSYVELRSWWTGFSADPADITTITVADAVRIVPATSITVDQSQSKNQGRWVSLGKFFNVRRVSLANKTLQTDPTTFSAIADAVMIVPSTIGPFGYSTAVSNIDDYTAINNHTVDPPTNDLSAIFAVTSGGRVLSMQAAPSADPLIDKIGKVNWIYPRVREDQVVSGSATADQAGLGDTIASPTFFNNQLFVATTGSGTTTGVVQALSLTTADPTAAPTVSWTFPDASKTYTPATPVTGASTSDADRPLRFSSSPAIDRTTNRLYIGTEDGSIYSLFTDSQAGSISQIAWRFPESVEAAIPPAVNPSPLAAIRYSTAAIATIPNSDATSMRRMWIAGAGGTIYSFNADTSTDNGDTRRLTADSTSQMYSDPTLRSPVYGSVALDSPNPPATGVLKPELMFVGDFPGTDQQGTLRWFLARSGLLSMGDIQTVDAEDLDSSAYFDGTAFTAAGVMTSAESLGSSFYYALVSTDPEVVAKWTFPTPAAELKYNVQVWFPGTYTNNPSGYTNTQSAEYSIRNSLGTLIAGPFTVNQTDTSISGKWHTITPSAISLLPNSYVELRSRPTGSAADSEPAGTITVADAVRIVEDSNSWANTGWPALGAIFSSPNVTNTCARVNGELNPSNGNKVPYIYFGATDGRVYALSPAGGAWNGDYAGDLDEWQGLYPDSDTPGENPLQEGLAGVLGNEPQFEVFTGEFFKASDSATTDLTLKSAYVDNPETKDTVDPTKFTCPNDWDTANSATPAGTLPDNWIVSRNMKLFSAFDGGLDTGTIPGGIPLDQDKELAKRLNDLAKAQRKPVNAGHNRVFPNLADRLNTGATVETNPPSFYVEWGETLNLIIWNLDPDELKSAGASVSVSMQNASSGSSAGTQLKSKTKLYKSYTVLDNSKPVVGVTDGFEPLTLFQDPAKQVKRAYALVQVELKATGSRPPTPGSGWTLTATIERNIGGNLVIDLARLVLKNLTIGTIAVNDVPVPDSYTSLATDDPDALPQTRYSVQPVGVNNPLAIMDDGSGGDATFSTGTPLLNARIGVPAVDDNGNWLKVVGTDGRKNVLNHVNGNGSTPLPVMWARDMGHGRIAESRKIMVADRSAGGFNDTPQQISNFRIETSNLDWQGAEAAIECFVPASPVKYGVKFPWELGIGSMDYPDIPSRYQRFSETFDGKDPAQKHVQLPYVIKGIASTYDDLTNTAIRPDEVAVTVDVPRFQPANNFRTTPNTGVDPRGYSRLMYAYVDSDRDGIFDSGSVVLGKPTTYQEAYRNFRYDLTVAPDASMEVSQTLVDVGLAPHGLGMEMPSGTFSPFSEEPYWSQSEQNVSKWYKALTIKNTGNVNIYRVRMDKNITLLGDGALYPIPGTFITSSLDPNPWEYMDLGNTLTKARVGDPDPAIMTIPDRRNWESMSPKPITREGEPYTPVVSVKIPISQPIGTYVAKGVWIYSDLNNSDARNDGEPVVNVPFDLKVTVRESQLTGGVIATSLPQIDASLPSVVGDAGAAAFRDPTTGTVHLVWSTNRRSDPPVDPGVGEPLRQFAQAPWFLQQATLLYSGPVDWFIPSIGRWWDTTFAPIPEFPWPDPTANVVEWMFGTPPSFSGQQVRHTQPTIGENPDILGQTFLGWAGSADIRKVDGSMARDERIFVTNITGGNIDNTEGGIWTLPGSPQMAKRSPSLLAYGNPVNLWAFWQGSLASRWYIYFANSSAPDVWSSMLKLRIPDCLSTVSGPSAVNRLVNRVGVGQSVRFIDMVYAGTGRVTRNSDILLTRYAAASNPDSPANPSQWAAPMPRVLGEELQISPKYGFYTSKQLAWVRSASPLTAAPDVWGDSSVSAPFIHVVLGDGYDYPAGTIVSATDGTIRDPLGAVLAITELPAITYDAANQNYVYEYAEVPGVVTAYDILGKMIVDFSEGVVKFTRPLLNATTGSGSSRPAVYADYTPQTLRLTTDAAVDSSPRAFIERTPMTPEANPGMGGTSLTPVDRMWVLWRRASSGAKGSVIYYKTMRMGIDLRSLSVLPVNVDANGLPQAPVTVSGTSGPVAGFEVDRTGNRIYLPEELERYNSLDIALDSIDMTGTMGTSPGPISITYTDSSGEPVAVTANTVTWIEENAEQSLTGHASVTNINEGSVWAFPDPDPPRFILPGTVNPVPLSKIWVFWTSTRGDNTDIFWETVFPGLTPK